jgi:homoserine/homoserine lactone efflux protein
MAFETWLIFALAYLLVTLSPGPNVLLVASHAVKYGYRSIAITISANLLCQMGIVMGVALGVGALMTVDSLAFKLIKYSGASYLVFLGAKMIYTALSEKGGLVRAIEARAKTRPGIAKRFREAFFVSAGNPKTVIFLAAFLPQFINTSAPVAPQFIEMYVTIALTVMSIHAIYAGLAVFLKQRIVGHRLRKGTSVATGGLFVFLGIGLSTS